MSTNKVALVTGCSEGGIGFYVCEKLAERGFIVYATSRSLSSMQSLVHPNIKRLALDVRNDSEVKSVVAAAIAEFGHVDLLINNAGIFAAGPLVEWAAEDVKDIFDTNVVSMVRLCAQVVPHMANRKSGTIVNVGSIVGEFSTPWSGIYNASKAAVHSLTENLWMECKPFNIRIMLAAPGSVRSKLVAKTVDFQLGEHSIYRSFFQSIRARLVAANDHNAMSTEAFAAQIVAQAVRPNPPRYFSVGGYLTSYRLFGALPRSIYLWIIWRMFSKTA
ncbi:NAD-binding protein [Mycena vitilis]|nr:NAD-binding protein [Mycena vitilis]